MIEPLLQILVSSPVVEKQTFEYLETEDRLSELVLVLQTHEPSPHLPVILLAEERIVVLPDWFDRRPGVAFPPNVPLNKKNLLGIVFGLLGNEQKMLEYLKGIPKIANCFRLMFQLQGSDLSNTLLEELLDDTGFVGLYDGYLFNHNIAIGLNYGRFDGEINPQAIESHYIDALEVVYEPVLKALSTYYYCTFLLDMGKAYEAAGLISRFDMTELPREGMFALRKIHCHAFVATLKAPLNQENLPEMKQYLWDTLSYYDKGGHWLQAASLYLDAAHVATLSNSYSEALGYITKAHQYFTQCDQLEMAGSALIEKGRLLYTWAKSGNPQFFRKALEAYTEALKVFTKEDTPDVFAEIHHQLGLIYAELPDEQSKKSIWASVSVTSFQEALSYYTLDRHPFEYGVICNHFANAYTLYPPAVRSDNYQKALSLYTQALMVRPADKYPLERSITLLNYLETAWKAENEGDAFNEGRYLDMKFKAEELLKINTDPTFVAEARQHLDQLEQLRASYQSEKH